MAGYMRDTKVHTNARLAKLRYNSATNWCAVRERTDVPMTIENGKYCNVYIAGLACLCFDVPASLELHSCSAESLPYGDSGLVIATMHAREDSYEVRDLMTKAKIESMVDASGFKAEGGTGTMLTISHMRMIFPQAGFQQVVQDTFGDFDQGLSASSMAQVVQGSTKCRQNPLLLEREGRFTDLASVLIPSQDEGRGVRKDVGSGIREPSMFAELTMSAGSSRCLGNSITMVEGINDTRVRFVGLE
ncbi:hypothetical protein NE237_004492 [Protea cynaroides]|uniref:Uncharacterized protein n=1 Tax=Protea cynaroides TaxID=273540 RepID=A0A9Q0KIR1_9MAGN|nr:hypothetical protein NE237_004492 [Protea cynaroides]